MSLPEFPGSPVVRAVHFHCREHGFDPWFLGQGTKIPHATKNCLYSFFLCVVFFFLSLFMINSFAEYRILSWRSFFQNFLKACLYRFWISICVCVCEANAIFSHSFVCDMFPLWKQKFQKIFLKY